jgi:hypothetical protein
VVAIVALAQRPEAAQADRKGSLFCRKPTVAKLGISGGKRNSTDYGLSALMGRRPSRSVRGRPLGLVDDNTRRNRRRERVDA